MPACESSSIAVVAAHAGPAVEQVDGPEADLLVALAGMADPRKRRGCRYRLATVLAVGVCAVLAGARSDVAIAEWAQDLPVSAREVVPSSWKLRWRGPAVSPMARPPRQRRQWS